MYSFRSGSCRGLQADGVKQGLQVRDDALIETVEPLALLLGESSVSRDGTEQPCGGGA